MDDPSLPKRTILKGLTYRLLTTIITITLVYIFIGDIGTASTIGCIEFFLKWSLFYAHERFWHQVSWGKSNETNNTTK